MLKPCVLFLSYCLAIAHIWLISPKIGDKLHAHSGMLLSQNILMYRTSKINKSLNVKEQIIVKKLHLKFEPPEPTGITYTKNLIFQNGV